MKQYYFHLYSFCLSFACIFVFLLCCTFPAVAQTMKIGVSIAPQAWLVEQIGGSLLQVETLVPAGSSPHTYEPKISQLKSLATASLYFSLGISFERAWLPRIKAMSKNMQVLPMDKNINKIPIAEHGHAVHAALLDPHVWTAPKNMLIMAKNTLLALQKVDADHAQIYEKRYEAVKIKIQNLDHELSESFASLPANKRVFLVFHPAWGYFAKAYGLQQVAIEIQGREPRLKDMQNIVDTARAINAQALFVQPQIAHKSAQTVASEIGAQLIVADPLAKNWLENLHAVAVSLREILQ